MFVLIALRFLKIDQLVRFFGFKESLKNLSNLFYPWLARDSAPISKCDN